MGGVGFDFGEEGESEESRLFIFFVFGSVRFAHSLGPAAKPSRVSSSS